MMKLFRLHWRMQRATLASAVVVVRDGDGRVLLLSQPSGTFQLPRKELDGRIDITHQVEAWLNDLLTRATAISLVSLEGSCGDVTLLYTAEVDMPPATEQAARWLLPDFALTGLGAEDVRLLRLSIGDAR
jgi:hypothetical protein